MDIRDRQMRDLQIQQIKIEDRREALALREQTLRQKGRQMDKRRELLLADWEGLQAKAEALAADRREFDDWAAKIRETSLRLQEERDKVLLEKAEYDGEREQLERTRLDLELQRSIFQSEMVRASELGHELEHREKMLQMLKYNRSLDVAELLHPTLTSCHAQRLDPRQLVPQEVVHYVESPPQQVEYVNEPPQQQ